jgi:type IV secretory pathway VirB2 component (pilin)
MTIIDDILGGIGDAVSGVENVFAGVDDFFGALTDKNTWVRVFFVVLGTLLLFGALRYGHH